MSTLMFFLFLAAAVIVVNRILVAPRHNRRLPGFGKLCPACGTQNPPHAMFCRRCGETLAGH